MGQNSSFAPAFFLLPRRRRQALAALHRFCRAADDAVDTPGPPQLEAMRHEVAALYGEGAPRRPETAALRPFVGEFGLEREYFEALLSALARDAQGCTIRDEDDLVAYGEGVAAAPGQLALAIFGARDARPYAHALGIALQCTNILRDLLEDWAEGRIYLPATDLAEFGIEAERLRRVALGRAAPDEGTRALVERQRQRIGRWFAAAQAAYRETGPELRRRLASARAMERIYRSLAAQLERRDPTRSRARIGPGAVLGALGVSWLEARRGAVFERV